MGGDVTFKNSFLLLLENPGLKELKAIGGELRFQQTLIELTKIFTQPT